MEFEHIKYQASELVVDDFSSMSPCFLRVEVGSQGKIHFREVDFFRLVQNLEERRGYYISEERQTSIFPKEIIVAVERNEWKFNGTPSLSLTYL